MATFNVTVVDKVWDGYRLLQSGGDGTHVPTADQTLAAKQALKAIMREAVRTSTIRAKQESDNQSTLALATKLDVDLADAV